MLYTETTKLAMRIAEEAHFGQLDRGGAPYICHPLHLAEQFQDETLVAVALLHDVLEDTDVTMDSLKEAGFSATILDAVDAMTRRAGETYQEYILRVKENTTATTVKLADLAHNLDESRCDGLPDSLRTRYEKAVKTLSGSRTMRFSEVR